MVINILIFYENIYLHIFLKNFSKRQFLEFSKKR